MPTVGEHHVLVHVRAVSLNRGDLEMFDVEGPPDFSGRLGLTVVHVDVLEAPRVKLTYLDAGNTYVQLVEPLDHLTDPHRAPP